MAWDLQSTANLFVVTVLRHNPTAHTQQRFLDGAEIAVPKLHLQTDQQKSHDPNATKMLLE